VEVVVSTRA